MASTHGALWREVLEVDDVVGEAFGGLARLGCTDHVGLEGGTVGAEVAGGGLGEEDKGRSAKAMERGEMRGGAGEEC